MKNIICTFLFFILFCCVSYAQKYTLAIIDLKSSGVDEYISVGVTDLIRTELHNSGLFNIIERSEMDNVLKKHNLKAVTCSEMDCAVKIGQILTADMILVGAVIKFGESLIINARLIDVKKVQIEFAEKAKVTNISYLDAGAEEFASRIIMRMGGQTPPTKQDYFVRRDASKNRKIGYISDVSEKNKMISIDIGYLEDVREGSIYDIKKKYKKIARCAVRNVGEYESECEVIKVLEDVDIERGDKAFLIGRERRGGITIMGGLGVPLKGINNFKRYRFMPIIHAGIAFDIILKFGLGFQFNASWAMNWDHDIYFTERYYPKVNFYNHYFCPFFIKYHFFKDTWVSPYIGVGAAIVLYRISEPIYGYSYSYSYSYSSTYHSTWGVAPVINWGFSFFSMKRLNLILDFRYYIGVRAPKIDSKRVAASALVFSLGFGINF